MSDAERISRLPEWYEDDPKMQNLDLTDRFKTPNGTWRLNKLQNWALWWIIQQRGLLGLLAAGSGKTIVSLLAAKALNAENPILMIPPTMQIPLRNAMEELKHHFLLPKNLRIVPYSQLSVASSTDLLDKHRPDLIICDEVHCVANGDAARSKRIIRYFKAYPETRFVALSGTLTGKGLSDYGHLSEMALRKGSPLPISSGDLIAWGSCVDSESRINARNLPKEEHWRTFAAFKDLRHIEDIETRREEARKVFSDRLRSTPGVVASLEGSIGSSLLFMKRDVSVPDEIDQALKELRKTWTRPDGEELTCSLELYRCGMELGQGFYLRWKWPDGIVDREWLNARAFWHREVRAVYQQNRVGLDSPLLIARAVIRHVKALETDPGAKTEGVSPTLLLAWKGWCEQKHKPQPPTETVWVDKFLIENALKWRRAHPTGIIWFSSKAVENALREAGERVFGAGEVPPNDGKAVCLSIGSHGTGLNLQAFSENLILCWPTSGKICEQLVARTHRQGSTFDEVVVWRYEHTLEAKLSVKKSRMDARYIESSTKASQKLCFGAWCGE